MIGRRGYADDGCGQLTFAVERILNRFVAVHGIRVCDDLAEQDIAALAGRLTRDNDRAVLGTQFLRLCRMQYRIDCLNRNMAGQRCVLVHQTLNTGIQRVRLRDDGQGDILAQFLHRRFGRVTDLKQAVAGQIQHAGTGRQQSHQHIDNNQDGQHDGGHTCTVRTMPETGCVQRLLNGSTRRTRQRQMNASVLRFGLRLGLACLILFLSPEHVMPTSASVTTARSGKRQRTPG